MLDARVAQRDAPAQRVELEARGLCVGGRRRLQRRKTLGDVGVPRLCIGERTLDVRELRRGALPLLRHELERGLGARQARRQLRARRRTCFVLLGELGARPRGVVARKRELLLERTRLELRK
ncbi:hypothetical protein GLX27_003140 [Malassezia furfur]|uniref:Uncharacterized protein n=1 Tax=Malassezia furfur TaxID=55194 RepID=A0ABY8EVJ8_MALFU|nr:hypothetical protein GLX27_003140 [Malassezia furfur]